MTENIARKWDSIYQARTDTPQPAHVLQQHLAWLPQTGTALDVACGQGGNALALAAHGLDTLAWDLSPVAIAQIQQRATADKLPLTAARHDIERTPPAAKSLDVIVVSHFLHRPLCAALTAALKPNGWLLYQTFCQHKPAGMGPNNPDFVLQENELLHLFSPLIVRAYHDGAAGNNAPHLPQGIAWFVAQKGAH